MTPTLLDKLVPGFSQEDSELASKVAQLGTEEAVQALIQTARGYRRQKGTWWKGYKDEVCEPYTTEEQLLAYQALSEHPSFLAWNFLKKSTEFESKWVEAHYEREKTGSLPSIFDDCDFIPGHTEYSFPNITGQLGSEIKSLYSKHFIAIQEAFRNMAEKILKPEEALNNSQTI
ncbi:hypothetical protein CMO92_00310 [Candidatus Woesearchaeota archaeon]|nr:hypothetical protein [Candidatus Woesearchaeota archaeon]|tara:strand:+ start:355 stop:876 length:522 start_codon:yes stop_codon:yes gene_type:complete